MTTTRPPPSYVRPPVAWIKRRARRIERFYGIPRRLAIFDAWGDYILFTGWKQPGSKVVHINTGRKRPALTIY